MKAFLSLFLVFSVSLARAENIDLKIDLTAKSSRPEAYLKRGYVLQGAVAKTDESYLDAIRKSKELGNELVGIFRDLNQFHHKVLFKSYRVRGQDHFGANGEREEFVLVDGKIETRINSQFLEMCRLAREGDMQIIVQLAGTPVEGLEDGEVRQLFTLDANRKYHGNARYYPIPVEAEFDLYAAVLKDWAKKLVEAADAEDTIWVGTQEPEHTLGFPGGIKTQEFRHTNLADYTRLWSRVSSAFRAEGWLTGGMQNNAGLRSGAKFLASIKELYANSCPIDFFSIQNYSGEYNERILREALRALRSKPGYENAKILFHRYQPHSMAPNTLFRTAEGIAHILKAEEVLLDNADKVYGYAIHTAAKGQKLTERLLYFLNHMPRVRKEVFGDTKKVGAFASADESKVSVAVWNLGSKSADITLQLQEVANVYSNVNVAHGSGKKQRPHAGHSWDADKNLLNGITLGPKEYLLIVFESKEA